MYGNLLALFLFGCALAQKTGATDVSDRAREAATKELTRLSAMGGSVFGPPGNVSLSEASLAEPFVEYASKSMDDTTMFGYQWADPADILQFATYRKICFPVVVGSEIVGTINVAKVVGRYQMVNLYPRRSGMVVTRLRELTRALGLPNDQRISVLSTNLVGNYYIVEDGRTVYRMAPADEQTMSKYQLVGAVGDVSTFAEPEYFAGVTRRDIVKKREQMAEH